MEVKQVIVKVVAWNKECKTFPVITSVIGVFTGGDSMPCQSMHQYVEGNYGNWRISIRDRSAAVRMARLMLLGPVLLPCEGPILDSFSMTISSTPQIHALSLQLIVCEEMKVSVCVSERYRKSPNYNATNYLLIDSSRWKLKHFGATSRCARKSIRWHAAGSSANLLLLLRGRQFLMPIRNK